VEFAGLLAELSALFVVIPQPDKSRLPMATQVSTRRFIWFIMMGMFFEALLLLASSEDILICIIGKWGGEDNESKYGVRVHEKSDGQ
jgi:hypothetical protein